MAWLHSHSHILRPKAARRSGCPNEQEQTAEQADGRISHYLLQPSSALEPADYHAIVNMWRAVGLMTRPVENAGGRESTKDLGCVCLYLVSS